MKLPLLVVLAALTVSGRAQVPENLVADGIPPLAPELRAGAERYLEFRTAAFNDWHPVRREVLITTRFADTAQLHEVSGPGSARRQLTFLAEPVLRGQYQPGAGAMIVFSQDRGGGEFYQLYRFDVADGRITRLTDGASRNTSPVWSRSGHALAYHSTRRTGRDTDLYWMDPRDPGTDRLLTALPGGGWSVADWSADDARIALLESLSINDRRLHLVEVATGRCRLVTRTNDGPVAYAAARFTPDGGALITTSDRGAEFRQLVRLNVTNGVETVLVSGLSWDVEEFDLSPDGRTIAFVTNEDGVSRLHTVPVGGGKPKTVKDVPLGVISGLKWRPGGAEVGFAFSAARSPGDAYSYDFKTRRLVRWTASETGGLNPGAFVEPELVKLESVGGLRISAFVYRPDPARFPGPRPAIILIHGGPESQSRPGFLARNNYFLNELGMALVVPNVRGSSGFGKTFLTLDNGRRREDAVRDIGTVIDWMWRDERFDRSRIAVMGGSYGGYMTLASLVWYSDRLRAGVDIVGISNFVTFLENTQEYRRDLRRVEYGDERDPAMRQFLERISPVTNVERIQRPLLIVQGANDPRVPASESEQMVRALRERGRIAWYLLARDEGHGFAKKRNQDFQFLTTIQFLREHVLNQAGTIHPNREQRRINGN
jgi:dipeptidyl aminopeptidase/acylaminoacyl peptidase